MSSKKVLISRNFYQLITFIYEGMEKGIILPSFYLGPIAYYSSIYHCDGEIRVERYENFPKQTYRNRVSIHSANGLMNLSIPVKKGNSTKRTLMKDVQISYDEDWQTIHWRTLQSAYRRSAYFEFYEDYFVEFYENKNQFKYLIDFNDRIHEVLMKLLKINRKTSFTEKYEAEIPHYLDLRSSITPRIPLPINKVYFQVFENKNGFIPNLSIVDLLFSQGPASKEYL